MELVDAILKSKSGQAEKKNLRTGKITIVRACGYGIGSLRVISSYTDPTVVRKLTQKELDSPNWEPI
jgi:hypothetical protein